MRSLGSVSFVSEASVPAQRNLYGEKTAYNAVAFCFVLGRMRKTGSYLRIFLMEMRRKRRLTKKHPDYEKARFEAGSLLRIHSLLGRQRKNSGCLCLLFLFCFTVDLGKTFWDGRTVRLGS